MGTSEWAEYDRVQRETKAKIEQLMHELKCECGGREERAENEGYSADAPNLRKRW